MLKNANESDIYHTNNEKMFMITNTNNFKNNINISINKLNPSFDNSSILKLNTHKAKSKLKNNIYSDLSKYLKHPSIDFNCNNNNINLADKSESGINGIFVKNLASPGKVKLEPLHRKELNYDQIKFNAIDFTDDYNNNSDNYKNNNNEYNYNNELKKEDLNVDSDPNFNLFSKINKIQIAKKNVNRNGISNAKENTEMKLFMSKNLKLKKHPEHRFNKYLKSINKLNDNKNFSFENNDFSNYSGVDNSDFSDKPAVNDYNNKIIYTKINKKIQNSKVIIEYEQSRKKKLKPIAITNESAIKNISNLVYDLMEKNNAIQSISNLFDNESSRFHNQ